MPIDGGLLKLSQWLSPGFPISAYAYSHGLETAIARGDVRDAETLGDWIITVLAAGAGRSDAILLCLTLKGDMPVETLAEMAEALAGSAERWEETRAQGMAFAETLRPMGYELDDAAYPVVLGQAARGLDLAEHTVAALFLQSFAANLVSVGVRFIPLGQTEGQNVLAGLHETAQSVAVAAAEAGAEDLGGAAFASDLAAMAHETQEVRLFRS
jgi:urease accessory protein